MKRSKTISIAILVFAVVSGVFWFYQSQATTTLIFVRHAEKETHTTHDPSLSQAGRIRAAELSRQLIEANVNTGIDAIYATPFKRTIETAQPVADALGLTITAYDAADNEAVLSTILNNHKGKTILVVGHSNTVPALLTRLGSNKKAPPISKLEYDNIYVVSVPWFGKTKIIRLRYGEPYTG